MNNRINHLTFTQKLAVIIALISLLFLRPYAFGLVYSIVGYILLLFSSIYLYITKPQTSYNHRKIGKIILVFYLINSAIDFYMFLDLYHAFISLFVFFVIYMLLSNEDVRYYLFKYYRTIVQIFIILAIINFYMVSIYGIDSQLIAKDFIKTDNYEYSLYFPFASSNNLWFFPDDIPLIGGVHLRQYFFFVEPGMVPPFFISLIFIIFASNTIIHKALKIVLIIVGVFLTMSTGGPLLLFFSLAVYYFFSRKRKLSLTTLVFVMSFVFVSYYSYNYMPFFGRQAKMEMSVSQAESIETHENILSFVIYQTIVIAIMSLILMRYKCSKNVFITIGSLLCLGNLSNYILFTPLATIFLFWDDMNSRNIKKSET